MTTPGDKDVEVHLFGPGYGESVLVALRQVGNRVKDDLLPFLSIDAVQKEHVQTSLGETKLSYTPRMYIEMRPGLSTRVCCVAALNPSAGASVAFTVTADASAAPRVPVGRLR